MYSTGSRFALLSTPHRCITTLSLLHLCLFIYPRHVWTEIVLFIPPLLYSFRPVHLMSSMYYLRASDLGSQLYTRVCLLPSISCMIYFQTFPSLQHGDVHY
ncbi:hypothetical protein BDV32DRAFT_120567 [Aspergillus pseudonomiae]|uniref:Uncharacterized protein n=1 Tax=Aspergillus pseudonomiae TaxID=1506151 RepID=A0A5N7DKK0_9EURO|nr:uncharacterized protein BDV37DRAFT_241604 [Aspergillus pseudonomiae]KAB8262416.1 hypothetical protein BDV32DRAFT_120567 [Aspergillus pseudonomiae]KAE8406976.1 hypothetical protein BDV37DRAFT_241604 [Aspergillus pseudonomiae]